MKLNVKTLALPFLVSGLCSPAVAAAVTKTYDAQILFSNGPIISVTQSFTLTFDPFVDQSNGIVSNYTVNSALPAFNGSIGFTNFPLFNSGRIVVGGKINGIETTFGNTDDFFTSFYIDLSGDVLPLSGAASYTTVDNNSGFTNNLTVTVRPTGAVPEPATWAMMIGGFGAIGGTMRYRRRKVAINFASGL